MDARGIADDHLVSGARRSATVGAVHRGERQLLRPARLVSRRLQKWARCPTTPTTSRMRHRQVTAPCLAEDQNDDLPDAEPPMAGGRGPMFILSRRHRVAGDWHWVKAMRYRLEVRLTPADVGRRVVIRWRRPSQDAGEEIADVLGILEDTDAASFTVRTSAGQLVVIPRTRALAGKVVPMRPPRRLKGPGSS